MASTTGCVLSLLTIRIERGGELAEYVRDGPGVDGGSDEKDRPRRTLSRRPRRVGRQ
jgi:hypothetical protein